MLLEVFAIKINRLDGILFKKLARMMQQQALPASAPSENSVILACAYIIQNVRYINIRDGFCAATQYTQIFSDNAP